MLKSSLGPESRGFPSIVHESPFLKDFGNDFPRTVLNVELDSMIKLITRAGRGRYGTPVARDVERFGGGF